MLSVKERGPLENDPKVKVIETLTRHAAHHVHVIIYPGFKAVEAAGAIHVLDQANVQLAAMGQPAPYEITLCTPHAGLVRSDTLLHLEAKAMHSFASLTPPPDTVIIVGARDIETALNEQPQIVEWIRHMHAQTPRIIGVCSGAFFLAAAGLLDGLTATTHWRVAKRLKEKYPRITVAEDSIYVRNDRIWTSAGVTAVFDLALALVEEDLGRNIALAVAREMVIYLKRPGGQPQFSQYLNFQMTTHHGIHTLQNWIIQHLDKDLSTADLARRVAMSPRNLGRIFLQQFGCSPQEFVELARMEKAKSLLEEGYFSLKKIATECGLSSEERLRRTFRRHCGITAREYRDRFHADKS